MNAHKTFRALLGVTAGLLLLGTFLVGCGDGGPELADVEGTVTLDGKPVPGATVEFLPKFENASTSSGRTDETGHYVMNYTFQKTGAMIGQYDVRITAEPDSDSGVEPIKIPKKYKEAGELTAEVKPGENTIDFPLTSQ